MLERRFTKFSEITQCNSHYAVQGHSRSPILVPIESSYSTSYQSLIVTYFLSCTISKLWPIFWLAREECLTLTLSLGVTPADIAISDISLKTTFFGLHFRCRKYVWRTFNHFYVIRPESTLKFGEITWRLWAITPFKVLQGHRVWYQSKAHMRLPISDQY